MRALYLNMVIGEDSCPRKPFAFETDARKGLLTPEVTNLFHLQDTFLVFDSVCHGCLLFPLAPIVIYLVGEPHATILLPALHLALMDWAPGWIARLVLAGIIPTFNSLGFAVGRTSISPTVICIRHAIIVEQVGDSAVDLLQQL